MHLLIDAGNSSLKWTTLKKNGSLSRQQTLYYDSSPILTFKKILKKNCSTNDSVTMVSVLGESFDTEAQEISKFYSLRFNNIVSTQKLGNITNAYKVPHKLGADRFVAMIGAYHLMNQEKKQKKACIIIDSGTATTIDAVDHTGQHMGGLILPGLNLCSSSLLKNTQLLPQWSQKNKKSTPVLFAKNTTDAIYSASIMGLSGAIDTICNNMERAIIKQSNTASVQRIICGGGSQTLLPLLNANYLLQQNLLMHGLNIIINSEKY